jgi:hypothetical protein
LPIHRGGPHPPPREERRRKSAARLGCRASTDIQKKKKKYSKKIEIVTRLVYWGQEKLFEEKNQR